MRRLETSVGSRLILQGSLLVGPPLLYHIEPRLTVSTDVKSRTSELEAERQKSAALTSELHEAKTQLEELPKVQQALASLQTGMIRLHRPNLRL
jgi:hypothetical protein